MMIESIAPVGSQPIGALQEGQATTELVKALHPEEPTGASKFGEMVGRGLESINADLMVSQGDLQQLATGNVENLHQIMIRLEESRLSFQLFLQVRNRLLEAYQDVMKMQV